MLERGTIGAIILAVGIAFAGLSVAVGVSQIRSGDRYVTVKGVAEREVRADVAIWPLHVIGADNDLAAAQGKLMRSIGRSSSASCLPSSISCATETGVELPHFTSAE